MSKQEKKLTKEQEQALITVAEHVYDCESGEYDSYITYCDELEIDPQERCHVYALALIGLGLQFPKEE